MCVGKKIKSYLENNGITHDNSYGLEPQESGVQDWLLPLSVRYENTYEVI